MFDLSDVGMRLGGRDILKSVDLRLEAGTLTVLVGPNGAGKSTLLKVLTGELAPSRGMACLDGEPLGAVAIGALARRRAVLPQASVLAFPFTVLEVVALGQESRRGETASQRRRQILDALDRVGLAGFGGRNVQELSGGEQQRVHLARVLCQIGQPVVDGVPRALFLDEPTASLDIKHQVEVLKIGREFADGGGLVFAVLHDLNLAAVFADRYIALDAGRLVLDAEPAAVLTDPRLAEIFGIALASYPRDGLPFVVPHTGRACHARLP
ncbi:hemin import ATP-binding protein HmuV [Aureimonas sp. SA4125]|uniref:heme ABC transporter ATP-binding protein n=1 Tax=Aureimonas sp. SA4125 TaxID=2826993 RepID=UPI001CC5ED06|nr:heme ABC transporter ATP-binding protein [Aureimonas sp. SA4125]BDA85691.1 hemin import ATP-binding protein HmuV [Aureimonas sp. SA4125]